MFHLFPETAKMRFRSKELMHVAYEIIIFQKLEKKCKRHLTSIENKFWIQKSYLNFELIS